MKSKNETKLTELVMHETKIEIADKLVGEVLLRMEFISSTIAANLDEARKHLALALADINAKAATYTAKE